jgi:hypothetical protein
VTGAGSTTLSDGNLFSTGNLALQGPGGNVLFGGSTAASSVFYFDGSLGQLRINTIGSAPRLTIAADDSTNLWNIDNTGGTLRVFRENYTDTGAGGGGAVRLSVTNAGVITFTGPINGSTTTPMFILDNEATSSQTVMEWRVAGTKRGSQRTDNGGNMVLNGNGTGAVYLAYDSGTGGVNFGNGATGVVASVNSSGEFLWASSQLSSGHGGSIELGGSGTPFLDFSNDTSSDFDVRLLLESDDVLKLDGGKLLTPQNSGEISAYDLGSYNLTGSGSDLCYWNLFGVVDYATRCTSLRSLKTNIEDLELGLDTIRQLVPRRYNWIKDGKADLGFVAEEVEAINPLLAEYDDNGKLTSVKYRHMIALAIEGIQELDGMVQDNTADVSSMQSQLNSGTFNNISNITVAGNTTTQTLTVRGTASINTLNVLTQANIASLTVAGDAQIQGKLTVTGDTEVADLYVNGKLISKGPVPQIVAGQALNGVLGASTAVNGTDGAGTIEVVIGANIPATGELAEITFDSAYATTPRIVLSGNNAKSAKLVAYITRTATGFKLVTDEPLEPNTTYLFDYIVIGAENP